MIVLRSSNIKGSRFDLNDLVKITKEIAESKWVKQISLPLLASVSVPRLPLELQNQFATFVQQVDKL